MPYRLIQSGFRNNRTARWVSMALWACFTGVLLFSVIAGIRGLGDA